MSDSRPLFVFHIGQHKTGSKALQSFLAHNHRRLLEHQIHYPIGADPLHGIRAYAISHYRLFALISARRSPSASGRSAPSVTGKGSVDTAKGMIQRTRCLRQSKTTASERVRRA